MPLRPRQLAALLAASLCLGGCLGRVEVSQIQAWRQDAVAQSAPTAKPRLWYIGVGLYDETWSENDVADLGARLASKADAFQLVPVVFSNRTAARNYPPATRANIDRAAADIARQARPGDVVLLYLSTHGARGLVARKESGGGVEPVGPPELREWLAPLGSLDTVVILSACFSGSLIPALAADHRIVIAAARADRTSFGCQADAEHTVFGQALLDALDQPHESLHVVFDKLRAAVSLREQELGIRLNSDPQIAIGPAITPFYDARAF